MCEDTFPTVHSPHKDMMNREQGGCGGGGSKKESNSPYKQSTDNT